MRQIIDRKGAVPESIRTDRRELDRQLLVRLYAKCNGFIQRIHEILTEQEGIKIGYSTLTRLIRELNIGGLKKQRCEHVEDQPGVEMQHDTSPYTLKIGDRQVRIVGSILYFRYCKMRYLKFYRSFNRFTMKCSFHRLCHNLITRKFLRIISHLALISGAKTSTLCANSLKNRSFPPF